MAQAASRHSHTVLCSSLMQHTQFMYASAHAQRRWQGGGCLALLSYHCKRLHASGGGGA